MLMSRIGERTNFASINISRHSREGGNPVPLLLDSRLRGNDKTIALLIFSPMRDMSVPLMCNPGGISDTAGTPPGYQFMTARRAFSQKLFVFFRILH